METSAKGLSGGRIKSGMIRSLGTFYQNLTKILPQNALPIEMFAHGVPYEASKTYRAMKSEFECKRALAIIEAQRQSLRGF